MLRIPRFFLPPFPKGENPPKRAANFFFPIRKFLVFFRNFPFPPQPGLGIPDPEDFLRNSPKKIPLEKMEFCSDFLDWDFFVGFFCFFFFPSGFAGKFQDGNEENQEFLIPLNPKFLGIFLCVFPYFSSLDFPGAEADFREIV